MGKGDEQGLHRRGEGKLNMQLRLSTQGGACKFINVSNVDDTWGHGGEGCVHLMRERTKTEWALNSITTGKARGARSLTERAGKEGELALPETRLFETNAHHLGLYALYYLERVKLPPRTLA